MPEKSMPVMEKSKGKGPDKWEIDSWKKTIIEAEEIKADPEKMKHVMPLLQKTVKAIKNIEDLRSVAKEKMSQDDSEDMMEGE